jgi:HCOMODA/2-hydroxy-3-carboxy-muconic semialdehyde decarboxylase
MNIATLRKNRRDFLRTALGAGALLATLAEQIAEAQDAKPTLGELMDDLVSANRILYDQGVVDGFGHISARDPQRSDRYWLARSIAPSLVTNKDLLQYDLDSNPINAQGQRSYLERFIHGEIYRLRPDVMAVIHSHSTSVVPFAATNVDLKPIFHMAGFLTDVKRWDIRKATGQNTDMLVRSGALGESMAKALGNSSVVLMRGHGLTVVGASIKEVVFRSVYTEVNARVQAQAIGLGGPVEYLNKEEAEMAAAANVPNYDRPWDLWKRRIGAR